MKVKLNGSNKFQPNLKGIICILTGKKKKKKSIRDTVLKYIPTSFPSTSQFTQWFFFKLKENF